MCDSEGPLSRECGRGRAVLDSISRFRRVTNMVSSGAGRLLHTCCPYHPSRMPRSGLMSSPGLLFCANPLDVEDLSPSRPFCV